MRIEKSFSYLRCQKDEEPRPDIAICSNCGGEFNSGKYGLKWESDGWEIPAYQEAYCKRCKNGGCIDDWKYSPLQLIRYKKWIKTKKKGLL